ncbi:uncharacterized protein LOC144628031 [Oculina patagonica]
MHMIGAEVILMMALLAPVTQGVKITKTGAGTVYKLEVVQDVTLERLSNINYLKYLIVSKHPGYPNKRSLVQFEDLPKDCPAANIQAAKMYLKYLTAHRPSSHTITQVPFIPRYMQVHMVRKAWKETQATRVKRLSDAKWSTPWLGLDCTDADSAPQECTPVTIFPVRPVGFVEFDITNAVRSWSSGVPNHGLVIRATNELDPGRDIRFASKAHNDPDTHAFVNVLCA